MKISWVGPTMTMNQERKTNRHERTKLLADGWRDPVKMLVRQPEFRWRAPGPVGIEVRAWCRADADRGAYFPLAKAMIDAVTDQFVKGVRVHTGWWPDDNGEWVHWEKHYTPFRDMQIIKGCVRVELEVVVLWDQQTP